MGNGIPLTWARNPFGHLLHRHLCEVNKARAHALTKGFTGRLSRGIHNRLPVRADHEGTAVRNVSLATSLVKPRDTPRQRRQAYSDSCPYGWQSANLLVARDVSIF